MNAIYTTEAFKAWTSPDEIGPQYTSSCYTVQKDQGQFLVGQVDYFANPVPGKKPWINYTPCYRVRSEAEAIKKADRAFDTIRSR